MKNTSTRWMIGLLGLTTVAWTAFAQNAGVADVEKELRAVNDKYTAAVRTTDAALLESVTTEDFVFVNEKGMVLPRVMVIAGFKSGGMKYEKVVFEDEKIHVAGDAAWITGKYTVKGGMLAQPFDGVCRVIRVFTKSPKGWLVSHVQITQVQGG